MHEFLFTDSFTKMAPGNFPYLIWKAIHIKNGSPRDVSYPIYLVDIYLSFGEMHFLHLQGHSVS
jgi:hypothetical protein